MRSFSESYRAAGVDIEAGYKGVKLMQRHVARTVIPGVVSDLGGFGGLFAPNLSGMKEPVLVSGTDGVGTKQRIAQLMDRHDTVGIDCVAMCVNDIICCGARPLFFLDYIAIGKNEPEKVASLVSGVAEGCVRAGCALIGGETAEHPARWRRRTMILPVSLSASWTESGSLTTAVWRQGTFCWRCPPAACTPTAIHWSAGYSMWSIPTLAGRSRNWARRWGTPC